MQAVISLLNHFAAALLLVGHVLVSVLFPHPHTTVVVATVATSTPSQATHVFPTVKNKTTASTTADEGAPQSDGSRTEQISSKKSVYPESAGGAGVSAQATPQTPELPPSLSASVVNDMARGALVNILCLTKSGGYLNPISGSGVIVTDSGVVLTNAHVGQYFLLRDYIVPNNVSCSIRTGSPASEKYKAELLYLPPTWINANASQIAAQEGMGTGENDYAFLRITSPIDVSAPLPKTFPALALTLDEPTQGERVLLAGYPAGFLQGITIEMNLYITSAVSAINEIFAFDDRGNPDVISVGGTVVSQAGSSGGAIVRIQDGALQGVVATATEGSTTDTRELRGITISHIDRSLHAAGLGGIVRLLSGDLSQKALDFQTNTAPGEEQKLIDALTHK